MSSTESPERLRPDPPRGRSLLRLTAGLAHTVNNALTGTVGYLELALRQALPGSELFRDIQAALACAYRAAETLRQVVAFATVPARVSSGSLSLREVAALAAGVARSCAPAGVTVVLTGDKPARVAGHASLMSAAVELIVRNALDAMPEGGRLTIETEEIAGRCRLWVRDSGPGVPAAVRERLFEPFVTTKSFGHLGLGLALAHELVRAQDGTLTVSSSTGIGTTVVFSFPRLEQSEADTSRPLRREQCQPSFAV
jgi:two-component system, cell cycle sensor histidine kinase and response regulator CckA